MLDRRLLFKQERSSANFPVSQDSPVWDHSRKSETLVGFPPDRKHLTDANIQINKIFTESGKHRPGQVLLILKRKMIIPNKHLN